MSENAIVKLQQVQDYRFDNHFADVEQPLQTDEPAPLGGGNGPSPSQLLAAAVANCLSASLLFAARKFRVALEPLSCESNALVDRNERNRLRVQRIDVVLRTGQPVAAAANLERLLGSFEDFCTVSQSVAQGIPVHVTVLDADGTVLKQPA
ncbi:OsmC family protein [Vogesella oryzae]|uniref:OsmC family protein n=1 Tax=Vogesella oryzae TaxID=1735285 RepID=UPI001582D68B|nr:OsmC family protein [Vogesella oryzae]